MTARQRFADELAGLPDDEIPAYLTARSGLPGPRGNLELLGAFGDVASPSLIRRLAGDEDEYLRCCGTAALGRLLLAADAAEQAGPVAEHGEHGVVSRGGPAGSARNDGGRDALVATLTERARDPLDRDALVATLTERARDPLWRVREGAAMAGQRLGAGSPEALAGLVGRWLDGGDPLLARAAIAAVCEPPILRPSPLLRAVALDACERATDLLRAVPRDLRRDAGVRTLRQALAYCWSVAVAADPAAGVPRFRVLQADADADVAWLTRENAKKTRLAGLL